MCSETHGIKSLPQILIVYFWVTVICIKLAHEYACLVDRKSIKLQEIKSYVPLTLASGTTIVSPECCEVHGKLCPFHKLNCLKTP